MDDYLTEGELEAIRTAQAIDRAEWHRLCEAAEAERLEFEDLEPAGQWDRW